MIGQTVSHYRIVRKIGEGGMGAVYEAQDLKLPRSVALKFLPETVAGVASAETRFLQEARIISKLEHPNIAAIYDIDETTDGDVFIVMPFYQGRTLDKMAKKRQLSIESALVEPMVIQGIGGTRAQRRDRAAALLREVGLQTGYLRR